MARQAPREITLPLDVWEAVQNKTYSVELLAEASDKPFPSVRVDTVQGMELFSTGACFSGTNSTISACVLTPAEQWTGNIIQTYAETPRGSYLGFGVRTHGRKMVVSEQIIIKPTAPNTHCAVPVHEAEAWSRVDANLGHWWHESKRQGHTPGFREVGLFTVMEMAGNEYLLWRNGKHVQFCRLCSEDFLASADPHKVDQHGQYQLF